MRSTSFKINRSLLVICCVFLLIGVRIFHLGVVQRESMLKEAQKPKIRSLMIQAERGEICDRFGIKLATSRICYNASIYYSELNQIPSRGWETDLSGHQVRTYPRREHIKKLAHLIEEELGIDVTKAEDLIHAKASILPHVPFVLKSDLSEEEYYRLKILEKDWAGLHAEISSKRYYPLGKVGCHLVGTLGSISPKQYMSIAEEIRSLQEAASAYETFGALIEGYHTVDEIYQRLDTLKDKAYTFNDKVGKTGIELSCEEDLRGSFGLKILEVDNQGKPLKELPGGKAPIPGNKISLTVSVELQQFAEELLIRNETFREGKSYGIDPVGKTRKKQKQPWIKGGAIVALDPKTGELLAMASCPRFDPNDFVENSSNTLRWLENEKMVGSLWDGKQKLMRERALNKKTICEDTTPISWDFFLKEALPQEGSLKAVFDKVDDIWGFVHIQEDFQDLLYFAKCQDAHALMSAVTKKTDSLWETLRSKEEVLHPLKRLDAMLHPISSIEDRLFAIDLCRLAINSICFSDELLESVGNMKVSKYRSLNQAFERLSSKKKQETALRFHKEEFHLWREENQRSFLTTIRAFEKKKKTYARPYIDYLDRKEKELFEEFWKENRISTCMQEIFNETSEDAKELSEALAEIPEHLVEELLLTFRSFDMLDLPLYSNHSKVKTEKDLASIFYPTDRFGYLRSYGFQSPAPQGSVFKLVSGYEALRQGHGSFSMIDEQGTDPITKQAIVAYSPSRTPFSRMYKGGRLPKTARRHVGKIDMVGAFEYSSNPYFSILAGDYFKDPEDLNLAASKLGYATKTGIDLPFETTGRLPDDLATNKTGLYSYAIGQHTLLCTPLQSALMLSTLANGGNLLKPQILSTTPLIRETIEMSPSIRNPIIEGMNQCVWSERGCARTSASSYLLANPEILQSYLQLKNQMVGKTGTAEVLFNPGRFPSSLPQIYKHIWFGSIGFDDTEVARWESPEIVVVVFMRFGSGGKEAAPLAGQIIQKWREIKKHHAK